MFSTSVMSVVFSLFCFLLVLIPAEAFVTTRRAPFLCSSHHHIAAAPTRLDSTENNNENDLDLSNFNPFQYQARSSTGIGISGTLISLRKTNMQALVGELLSVYGDDDQTFQTLAKYKDFLLEPLDDLEAPLDPESIYNGIDTRHERYQAYRTSMQERIATASDRKAKQVLQTMMDYVLQFE